MAKPQQDTPGSKGEPGVDALAWAGVDEYGGAGYISDSIRINTMTPHKGVGRGLNIELDGKQEGGGGG